jgi:hypothetical protein
MSSLVVLLFRLTTTLGSPPLGHHEARLAERPTELSGQPGILGT